jgi:WD40 repeat protein
LSLRSVGRIRLCRGRGNSILRWDITAAKNAKTSLAAHDGWGNSFAFSGDGETEISGGYDGRLIWWPVAAEKPQPIRTMNAHQGWGRCLAASPDGKLLLSGGNDRLVRLWNFADETLIREFSPHDSHVDSVALHPSERFAHSSDLRGHVPQWDVATGALVPLFEWESQKLVPQYIAERLAAGDRPELRKLGQRSLRSRPVAPRQALREWRHRAAERHGYQLGWNARRR